MFFSVIFFPALTLIFTGTLELLVGFKRKFVLSLPFLKVGAFFYFFLCVDVS